MRIITSSKGDTIIEVLISIAVISAVISGTFTILNRSVIQGRQAQERVEATKLASQQIERIKSIAPTYNDATTPTALNALSSNNYCIATDRKIYTLSSGSIAPLANNDDFTKYNANCVMSSRYHVGVVVTGTSPDYNLAITVRWNTLGASDRSETKLNYKIHK